MDSFLTTTRQDYKWPYPIPISFRPTQPKIETKEKNYYMKRPSESYCHCDTHQYDPQMNQYKQLGEKENLLLIELALLNKKQVALSNYIMDHPCDTDDIKLESVYTADYKKRGMDVTNYRKMMVATDSKAATPIKPPVIGLLEGYRDPTCFRLTALKRPTIDPCPPVTFAMTPKAIKDWFEPVTGRTEYQDNVSKTGLGIMKYRQQYKEPLPSSRRRFGDPCL